MDLSPYVNTLRSELTAAAEVGGQETRSLAARLLQPLDAAVKLTLLEALSAAAEEISAELAPGSVDVRLRGGAATFAVTPPPGEPAGGGAPVDIRVSAGEGGDDAAMVRINLRLPGSLKNVIEDAAAAGGVSVNAWIVRAAAAALAGEGRGQVRTPVRKHGEVGQSFTGWGR